MCIILLPCFFLVPFVAFSVFGRRWDSHWSFRMATTTLLAIMSPTEQYYQKIWTIPCGLSSIQSTRTEDVCRTQMLMLSHYDIIVSIPFPFIPVLLFPLPPDQFFQ